MCSLAGARFIGHCVHNAAQILTSKKTVYCWRDGRLISGITEP